MKAKFSLSWIFSDSDEFMGIILHEPNIRTRQDEDDVEAEAEDQHHKLFLWVDDYVQTLSANVYSDDDIR